MTNHRIAGAGRLSGKRRVSFTFDGKRYSGLEGDTLASALLANGIHLTGRSFKYHRPRGILGSGPEEPNALMEIRRDAVRRTPNIRATMQPLYEGLDAVSQNRWPNLDFDVGEANSYLSRFLTAGFYYKTFMWPASYWHKVYEPKIRAAAGLGRAPEQPDTDRYANRFVHVDVLVVGGGATGLAAAVAAGETGASVILADENLTPGGWLRAESRTTIDGLPAMAWVARQVQLLRDMPNVRLLTRATVFGYYNQNMLAIVEQLTDHLAEPDGALPRERLWQVRAKRVVLAPGAIERPLVFPDNDRPGIMLASAGRLYLNHHGVTVGRQVAFFTANDSAYAAAADFKRAGISVPVIVDLRDEPGEKALAEARESGIEVLTGYGIKAVRGIKRIKGFTVEEIGSGHDNRSFDCDALLVSGGFTPSIHLFSQSRGTLSFSEALQAYVPAEAVQACDCVGALTGDFDLAHAIDRAGAIGSELGSSHAEATGSGAGVAVTNSTPCEGAVAGATPAAGPGKPVKAFVDYQNDVTARDIRLAIAEGFTSVEHIKRFTTNGMATDQGKTSNIHGIGVAAETMARSIPQIGQTTFRAPYTPVTFGSIAGYGRGDLFDPKRETPIHDSAVAEGAAFEDVSLWKRAWYFGRGGQKHQAVTRECRAVRAAGGLFDASTLGKIEVVGPDAARFLDLIYATPLSSLKPGKCRYALLLNEAGFVIDDGIIARLAEDRFHVTTTSGGAPRVLQHMEDYRQTEFPELKVWTTSATDSWAVIAVQGPKARELVAPFVDGQDLSNDAFPHMSVVECRFMGVRCRLFRVSFTGELGYEINLPSDYGRAAWDRLREAGRPLGFEPYGTETMHVLRAEKGYIIVGQETDGTVTPGDAGLNWAVSKKKADFVGKRGLERPDLSAPGRKQLVGLKTLNPLTVLEEGAQIVADPNEAKPMTMLGHVTSAYHSDTFGRSIAMALIRDGRSRIGETLYVPMPDETITVEVIEIAMYDPDGERLNG